MRLYCGLLLLLETAVNGALCATDLVLFVMFFAMQAVPLYLLIRCFGGAGRERSAARVGVGVLSSAALLLTGFLLVIVHSSAHSSDLIDLATAATPLSGAVATAGFWLVFTAFAIGFVHRARAHLGASTPPPPRARGSPRSSPGWWCASAATA